MLDAEFLEAARALIGADTLTEHGNLRAVALLEPICRAAGLEPIRIPAPDSPGRDANLLAGPGGGVEVEGDPLLLVTHLDTVEPGPREAWRTDPFSLTVEGEQAFGLGVADVKLDALCKLWAARRLIGVRLSRPFYFLGTYGEEAGLRGAKAFVAEAPFRPAFALCGEPCALRLHHAHKGYAMVRVTLRGRGQQRSGQAPGQALVFEGKAAHSSTPQLGVNAIDRALDALVSQPSRVVTVHGGSSPNTIPARCEATLSDTGTDLRPLLSLARELRDRWKRAIESLEPARDERFDPATAVGSLTQIFGDDGSVAMVMDARLLPAHEPRELLDRFDRVARVPGIDVSVEVLRDAGGMSLAEDSELVRRAGAVLERLGLDGRPVAKPTSTEGGVFHRAGVPTLVFGPSPSTANAHTPNERASLREVERAIDVYEALVRELCG